MKNVIIVQSANCALNPDFAVDFENRVNKHLREGYIIEDISVTPIVLLAELSKEDETT